MYALASSPFVVAGSWLDKQGASRLAGIRVGGAGAKVAHPVRNTPDATRINFMSSAPNLVGQRFSRLLVLSQAPSRIGPGRRRYSAWNCVCDCGTLVPATDASKLKSGHKKSCGCLQRTAIVERTTTHGQYGTPVYRIWAGIKKRCFSSLEPGYERYGGRGITLCPEWRDDFAAFAAYLGPRPSALYSVDRVDNDGNYEPGNVRWATKTQQANNTRANVKHSFHGEMLTIPQIAERVGMAPTTIFNRLKVGRPLSEAADPLFEAGKAGYLKRQQTLAQRLLRGAKE